MNRLKALRSASGMTQAAVASALGTNQQTYARWENEKSEPSHAVLLQLSELFGTTVDHILGRGTGPKHAAKIAPWPRAEQYWGDLGLSVRGSNRTFGFPMSEDYADRVRQSLASGERLPEWIVSRTLNNRIVAFRPRHMRRMWLVDDASEFPEEFEFSAPFGTETSTPLQVYQAAADWADCEDGGEDCFLAHPKALQKQALDVIKRCGFLEKPHSLSKAIRDTVLHHIDGEVEAYEVRRDHLSTALLYLECVQPLDVIELSEKEQDFERFHALEDLALIEFSAVELEAAWAEEVEK